MVIISHHIIFQNLCKVDSIKEPEVVAKTLEKFVTFSIGNRKFKDSLQFLNSSLDKLVSNLAGKEGKKFYFLIHGIISRKNGGLKKLLIC